VQVCVHGLEEKKTEREKRGNYHLHVRKTNGKGNIKF
jgi:hypothetical protein